MGYLTSVCLTQTAFRGSICSVGYQMDMSQCRQNQRVVYGSWLFALTLESLKRWPPMHLLFFNIKLSKIHCLLAMFSMIQHEVVTYTC